MKRSIPTHVDLSATHEPIDGRWIKRLAQQLEILLVVTITIQVVQEPADGHVRNRVKPGEADPGAALKFTAIVTFQLSLLRRQ